MILDVGDRPCIHFMALDKVHDDRNNDGNGENHRSPIEADTVLLASRLVLMDKCAIYSPFHIYWRSIRPEREKEYKGSICHGDSVDKNTPLTQAPASLREQMGSCNSSVQHTGYRYQIGSHHASGPKRDDGVERGVGSYVDQRQEYRDYCAHYDCICGHHHFGVDLFIVSHFRIRHTEECLFIALPLQSSLRMGDHCLSRKRTLDVQSRLDS